MNQKNHSGSRSAAGAQPIFFFLNPRKTSIQLLLEAQQHKKYAQTTLYLNIDILRKIWKIGLKLIEI
jgi:hypothetical protein